MGTCKRSLLPFSLRVLFRTSLLGRLGSVSRTLPLLMISPPCGLEGVNARPPPWASNIAAPSRSGSDRTFFTVRPEDAVTDGKSLPARGLLILLLPPTSTIEADPGAKTCPCTAVTNSDSVSERDPALSRFWASMSPLMGDANLNERPREGVDLSELCLCGCCCCCCCCW